MDILAFGSLAQIRILLIPVGSTKRADFDKWAAEIRTFDSLRLGDVPSDTQQEKARFMPNPLAAGHLHLSYPSHPPPHSQLPLSLFRPSDFPLGVIGIATCSQNDSLSSILAHFNAAVSDLFPAGFIFPLATNCFVFEENDSNTNLNLGDTLPGLVVIPSMMGNKKIYIGTLLADLCSNILGEFSTVQTLETPLGNEYLNSALFPTLPSLSDIPKPLDSDVPARSSLPPIPTYSSQPELTANGSTLRSKAPTPLSLKRTSTLGPGMPGFPTSPYRHASLPTPTAKKKPLAIGAVSSHGRLFKVFGDLFLLAGRTEDASIWYTEAIATLKSTMDAPWNASALEGLAVIPVIEAWSSSQALNGGSGDKEPWADIVDKLTQASNIYFKATPADAETDYAHLSHLYVRAVLRHVALLSAIWSTKGWGPLAFKAMLQPGVSHLSQTSAQQTGKGEKRLSTANLERLSLITGITRCSIAAILSQAHGPWLLHLGSRERVTVLESIASVYGSLSYKRKEAYILREVLGCIMDLVVCGREEPLGNRVIGTGLGIQGVEYGGRKPNGGTVGIRENESTEGNQSVIKIVKHVCRIHGIDLEAVKLFDTLSMPSKNDDAAGDDLMIRSYEPFGWPELQIGIVREAVAVAEALPDYPSVAQFCLSALKTLHVVTPPVEQVKLYDSAARAMSTARRRGDTRSVDYWSGQPIVSLEVLSPSLVRLPIEKPISILSQRRSDVAPILTGMTDPFLYNPRRALSGQGKTLLVQHEPFELVVTLRNPYIFDLELASLSLSTTGARIESQSTAVVVPANSFHPVTIVGTPLESGPLIVRGCVVQAPGGVPREFVLPLSTDEEEQKQSRRRSAIECEKDRSKYAGLDSRPWEKSLEKRSSLTQAINKQNNVRFLQCTVVPEQPLLRIRRTSLTHGAVMLYNGESSTIRITFENISTLPIDFLRLTFDDSTIAPAQQALADGELSVFDTYETEYDLIHRPVFSWDSKRHNQELNPGDKVVYTVNCFGKVGCTNGVIHVSYSYIHRRRNSLQEPLEVFHTRQLSYPVLVTVYHMLECHSMDIVPYSQDIVTSEMDLESYGGQAETQAQRALLNVDDVAEWCMFSVEIRNTYGLPFEVKFERDQPGAEKAAIVTVVPPGATRRIVIPIKKFILPEDHVSRPIPTLSDRQFVVTKSNLTSAEEQLQRELFWYREELFKAVPGKWKESGGNRCGELSLRRLRLTRPMLDVLRTEAVRVYVSLVKYDEDDLDATPELLENIGGKWYPPPHAFVHFRTRVTNLSSSQLVLTANMAIEPAQHVVYEGVLSEIPVGRLESGQSAEFELPLTFVASGRFHLESHIRILGSSRERADAGWSHLQAIVHATSDL
ncbi:TRAPP II complex [Abortiporus biennis]|nr:TRAPP II complex [Abortiporus biennis]